MYNCRYTWNRNWIAPYESFWSILNKFAYLNNVSLKDVKNLFKDASFKKPDIKNKLRWNLHLTSKAFDENNLCSVLYLKPAELQKSLLTSIIMENDIEWLTPVHNLRYCPKCISHGYHSIFHQTYLFTECPVHGTRLIEECPNCKSKISYSLTLFDKILQPYACPDCEHEFRLPYRRGLETDTYRLNGFALDEFQQDKMDHIFNWFNVLKNSSTSMPRRTPIETDNNNVEQNKNDILNCCATLIGSNLPDAKSKLKRGRELAHNVIQYSPGKSDFDACPYEPYTPFGIEYSLILIYKSIRRHFSKLMKFKHMQCIEPTRCKITLGDLDKTACCYSLGWLSWEEYWGNRIRVKTQRYHYLNWKNPFSSFGITNNSVTNMWLTSRIFANCCFWTFVESILISRWIEVRGNFSSSSCTLKIKGTLNPYWSVQVNDMKQIVYHQWVKSKHLKALKKIEVELKERH